MNLNSVFISYANLDDLSLNLLCNSPLISSEVMSTADTLTGDRKKQFIACRYLLATLMNTHFQCAVLPSIKIGDNSRPCFVDNHLPDFNITHSKNFVAVAIATKSKIGIDIELHRERKRYLNIAQEFFSPQEVSWLSEQASPLNAFWQLWTLRESALKLYAKGVWQMKEMQIAMPQQHISAQFAEPFYSHHQKLGELYLSVCCDKPITTMTIDG